MDHIQNAQDKFLKGYSCSQAVFSEYCTEYGINQSNAVKIAAGLSGGICMGKTCGAVTGAIMVLGLKYGDQQATTISGRKKIKDVVNEFINLFSTLNGSTECKDLLSVDISTPEGQQAAKEQKLFQTICPKLIKDATAILESV